MKILCVVLLSLSVAMAQTKVTGTFECGKADEAHSINIGDSPDHTFTIAKTNCKYTKPFKLGKTLSKTFTVTLFTDSTSSAAQRRAAAFITMENGDKLYYRSEGSAVAAKGTPSSAKGNWVIDGGTGKFEGAKGKGTYDGVNKPDGTRVFNSEGEISLAK